MLGVMFITSLAMLHESNLIGTTNILPDNAGIMTLLFLKFVTRTCSDFDLGWRHEVVRAADKYGVVLTLPRQLCLGQDDLDDLKEECKMTKMRKGLAWKTEVSQEVFELSLNANRVVFEI